MNKVIEERTSGFYKFHSREWVEDMQKKVEKLLTDNKIEITKESVDKAINVIAWSPETPYLTFPD